MARKRKLQIASLLLCSTYFVLLLRSPHATRASFISVVEIREAEFFARPPESMDGITTFEDPARLGFFRELLPLKEGPTLANVVAITRWMGELKKTYTRKEERFSSVFIPEYPMDTYLAMINQRLNTGCHNETILINTMFQANGIKARRIDFMQLDGFGGAGHTLSEVWLPERKKWMLVDGQQAALFFLNRNN